MSQVNCGCCGSVHQYIAEHIDPSGTIEAEDSPETIMARIEDMYKDMGPFAGPPITLDDVRSYIEGIKAEKPARKHIEEDWVCPECYANVRCDCE